MLDCTADCYSNSDKNNVNRKSNYNCDQCTYKPSRNNSVQSHIVQVDGNASFESDISVATNGDSSDCSSYATEDEAFSDPIPVSLSPAPDQQVTQGQPIRLEVNLNGQPSPLPLCLILNARSVFNKADNLIELLSRVGPDLTLISESWEREKKRLNTVLTGQFKSVSYYRKGKSPGGGCAIIYNETRFSVNSLDIQVPNGVECVWALFTPKSSDLKMLKVKRIAVGSFYISPRSQYKNETIEHIIQSIHILRAKYDNQLNFLLGGDFNRVDINDILDSYGALKSIISVSTRKSATLEILLTDLHTMFHPPTTLPPLQVDKGKVGKDSDHNIVVFAPISNIQYQQTRQKKTILTRPLPESEIFKFEKDLIKYP